MKVTFERDVARILCKKHNIRAERCDCEHRAVLAGQQGARIYLPTVSVACRTVPYRTVILMLKTLIWCNLLEKRKPYRDAFLYEKARKTNICAVRFALKALFSFKNEIFSSTDRTFYKNAQIFTTVRLALTFFF
jgi:hypothetical protein